jgi:hypothetical protein
MKGGEIVGRRDGIGYVVLCAVLVNCVLCQNAYGYLDPGSGSVIFQILIGLLLALLFALKVWWLNIKLFFRRLFSRKTNDAKEDK